MAIRLANLEGGFLTLQQYAEQILAENKAKELQMRAEVEQLLQKEEPPVPEEIEETPRDQVITEADLLKRSTKFRNSQKHKAAPKKRRTTKKKPVKKKPEGSDES